MIQLHRLFENHLADLAISAEELRNFAEDFHSRLEARGRDAAQADAATCAALAASLDAPFTAFDAALGQRQAALATQQAGTITKDEAVQLIHTTIRQREGRIRDAFAKGTAGYEAFFPRGLSQYTRATLGQIPALLDQLIAAATAHQAQTGAPLLAEFQALKTTFTSARGEQVDKKGSVSDARAAVALARGALELALGAALLGIARLHLGHPEHASQFFTQSLLEDPDRSQADDTPPAA